jgi:hypothetical protein
MATAERLLGVGLSRLLRIAETHGSCATEQDLPLFQRLRAGLVSYAPRQGMQPHYVRLFLKKAPDIEVRGSAVSWGLL